MLRIRSLAHPVFILALTACAATPPPAKNTVAPSAPTDTAVPTVAQPEPIPTATVASDPPYSGPAHVFHPRPHVVRAHPAPTAPGNLWKLPRLVNRMGKCFAPTMQLNPGVAGGGFGGGIGLGATGSIGHGAGSGGGAGFGAGGVGAVPKVRMGATSVSGRVPSGAMPSAPPTATSQPGVPSVIAGSPPGYYDWGAAIYLSNDDTMSLSSAQRILYAIDGFLPLPRQHIRHHELLNYFSFDTSPVPEGGDFSVKADLSAVDAKTGAYSLSLAVNGRPLDKQTRRNAAITFVVDRSGSMSDEGRMDFLKRGMHRMMAELKRGDQVNVVIFDDEICVPLENFVVGRDSNAWLQKTIDALEPRGSTDLHRGLTRGYELANKSFQEGYSNRVVLITDALTNTGVTHTGVIAAVGKHYDDKRIRLSGIGVGRSFNDELLDRLTERGRGAYVFLGSEAEVDKVMGERFVSLLETTAVDVHFRLHLPPSLRMEQFHGEESSTVKQDVQAIHYSANTSQLFLADLIARGKTIRPQDQIMLTIEYKDPETEQELVEEVAYGVGEILGEAKNVRKGRLLMRWADGLDEIAARQEQLGRDAWFGDGQDEASAAACDRTRSELSAMAMGLQDAEVRRVLDLWESYCVRYERRRNPVRRRPVP